MDSGARVRGGEELAMILLSDSCSCACAGGVGGGGEGGGGRLGVVGLELMFAAVVEVVEAAGGAVAGSGLREPLGAKGAISIGGVSGGVAGNSRVGGGGAGAAETTVLVLGESGGVAGSVLGAGGGGATATFRDSGVVVVLGGDTGPSACTHSVSNAAVKRPTTPCKRATSAAELHAIDGTVQRGYTPALALDTENRP